MTQSLVFTFQQVQTTCSLLIKEEQDLIVNNILPERSALIANLFAIMAFDHLDTIDRNMISKEQAELIEQYS